MDLRASAIQFVLVRPRRFSRALSVFESEMLYNAHR